MEQILIYTKVAYSKGNLYLFYFLMLFRKDENMTITVKRKTGWLGMGVSLMIKINGEKTAKIGYGEMLEVAIPDKSAQLKVSQSGARSNEIEVRNGDTVEITTSKSSYVIWLLLVIAPALLHIFTDSLIIFIVAFILLAIGIFLVNHFKLSISNRQPL